MIYSRPKMVLFDYWYTLDHGDFNKIRGHEAVLRECVSSNRKNWTAGQVYEQEHKIVTEYFSHIPERIIEFPARTILKMVYEYMEIEVSKPYDVCEKVFQQNAMEGCPTENIKYLLEYLNKNGIRTGVISNLQASGERLTDYINGLIPDNRFEFVLVSSEYALQKPNPFMFEIAIKKSGLSPDEIWFCGDNPVLDIMGSDNVGMRPVWYTGCIDDRRQVETPTCDCLKISNWRELVDIIENSK